MTINHIIEKTISVLLLIVWKDQDHGFSKQSS